MAFLLHTDVAIHLRDGDPAVAEKVSALDDAVLLSIVTRVELEGGVYRDPAYREVRRVRLDTMPFMGPAQALYERMGFVDCAPYPIEMPAAFRSGIRYMELAL